MEIEYVDKEVESVLFEKVCAGQVFMMQGKLYMSLPYAKDEMLGVINCVNIETGRYDCFGPKEPVCPVKTKLIVEI